MFIQLSCGCIGLLIASNDDGKCKKDFYKIIDCTSNWGVCLYESTDDLNYKRYRVMCLKEVEPIINLISFAIGESNKFSEMKSILGLDNSKAGQLDKELNDAFASNRTMKAVNALDIPEIFPFDDRLESEKQKEINYIKRHSK